MGCPPPRYRPGAMGDRMSAATRGQGVAGVARGRTREDRRLVVAGDQGVPHADEIGPVRGCSWRRSATRAIGWSTIWSQWRSSSTLLAPHAEPARSSRLWPGVSHGCRVGRGRSPDEGVGCPNAVMSGACAVSSDELSLSVGRTQQPPPGFDVEQSLRKRGARRKAAVVRWPSRAHRFGNPWVNEAARPGALHYGRIGSSVRSEPWAARRRTRWQCQPEDGQGKADAHAGAR